MTSRGIRNANPCNIDRDPNTQWQGAAEDQSTGPRFVVFTDPKWGIRAAARLLINYQTQHGLSTIRGMINRWAPPGENNTSAYVTAVASAVGVSPDAQINVDDEATMTAMVRAIILHENGSDPYPDSVIAEGIHLAGVVGAKGAPLSTQKPFVAQVGGGVAVLGAAATQASQYAPILKGWADQLSAYAGAPIIQHVQTIFLTVAGGLAILGIVSTVLNHRKAA
jgi:hypothetical protein